MNRKLLSQQSGFTLIEITLVFALSGMLFVIAFAGQRQLRDRAEFDGAVNKLVQEYAYARNYSTSNVNTEGLGANTSWVVTGAELELADHHPSGGLAEVEPYYCNTAPGDPPGVLSATCLNSLNQVPGSIASCPHANVAEGECFEQGFSDPGLKLTGINEVAIIYLNTGNATRVCQPIIDDAITETAACSSAMAAPYTFHITDPNGQAADIEIDTSGRARRLN